MQIQQLKDLLKDFGKNVIYDQDLKKKKIGSILEESLKFFTRRKI